MRKFPLSIFATLLIGSSFSASAQEKKAPQKPTEQEEVVRVNVDLVQMDVMVFDKDGRFIEGLRPDQFELMVDGKPQPIAFFERIVMGGNRERAVLKGSRSSKQQQPTGAPPAGPTAEFSERGRTIIFFVNDLHISPASLSTTHKTINQFIDNLMGPNDQAAITSSSGQIGYLQQLTNNRAVLHAALDRIKFVPGAARDGERPPMSDYAALLIHEQKDRQLFDYFVDATMRANSMTESERAIAAAVVTRRSQAIVRASDFTIKTALQSLVNLMRTTAKMPGRKLVFFVSDGFTPNFKGSDFTTMIGNATDAAANSGVVIYSLDARGLTNASALDAGNGGGFDPTGVLQSRMGSELSFSQEPLHALAADTGGRAFLNSNSLIDGVGRALDETSRYYLLAWRPNNASQRSPNSAKIKVTIADHPDYKVQLRRGYLGMPLNVATSAPAEPKKEKPEGDSEDISSDDPLGLVEEATGDLQTSLSLGYKRTAGTKMELTAAVQLIVQELGAGGPAKTVGSIATSLLGAVFDSKGKPVGSFRQRLEVPKTRGHGPASSATFNYRTELPPGLYQVRTVARERGSTHLSGAMDWIEIPSLKPGAFSTSSLYVGEITETGGTGQVGVQASGRFARNSRMRFTTFIYNAVHTAGPPELWAQIKVLCGDQPVVTPPEMRVKTEKLSNFDNITYAGEFPLNSLPAGRYMLEVTVTDRTAKTAASQQFSFTIY